MRRGEILGFAGSEGNGQREALRALGGFEEASGQVVCAGRPMMAFAPRDALDAGILSLSADRSAESIFPTLGRAREHDRAGARRLRHRRLDLRCQGTARCAFARRKAEHCRCGSRSADRRAVRRQSAKGGSVAQLSLRCEGAADRRADPRRRRQGALRYLSRDPRQGRSGTGLRDQFFRCHGIGGAVRSRAGVLARPHYSRAHWFRNHRRKHRLVLLALQGARCRLQGDARAAAMGSILILEHAAIARRRRPAMRGCRCCSCCC